MTYVFDHSFRGNRRRSLDHPGVKEALARGHDLYLIEYQFSRPFGGITLLHLFNFFNNFWGLIFGIESSASFRPLGSFVM